MGLFRKLFSKQDKVAQTSSRSSAPPPLPEPEPLQIAEVTPADLAAMLRADEPITVVDLRHVWEYRSGHIPGAVNIPMVHLPGKLNEIPKDHKVVMQCYHGISSLDAAGYLIQNGWAGDNVANLSGGISGWVTSQGPDSLEKVG